MATFTDMEVDGATAEPTQSLRKVTIMKASHLARLLGVSHTDAGSSSEANSHHTWLNKRSLLIFFASGVVGFLLLLGGLSFDSKSVVSWVLGSILSFVWLFISVRETNRNPNGALARIIWGASRFAGTMLTVYGMILLTPSETQQVDGGSALGFIFSGLALLTIVVVLEMARDDSSQKISASIPDKSEATSDG